MKVACLSMAPLYGEFVLGGSQKVLNDIILGLRKNNIEMRVFSPRESNITKDSYIGDVKIEKSLNLSGSFPSPFEIPLYEIQDLSNKLLEITDWADRIYLHGDGWFLRDEFSNKMIISGIHDLVYQESLSSVFSFLSNNTIVPSNYLLETIHSSIDNKKFSSNNFSVIPNSISLDTNKNIKNKELDENLVILFPHRPDPRKGFNKAIEIANEFAKTKNWKNVILKSCTFNKSLNKDKKNTEFLEDKNYKEFLSNNGEVIFNDWIPFNKMGDFYSSGDLTLCPGDFIESFGLVPLESLANNTPALCSSVGAFRDLRNIPGIELISYGDIKDFVEKGMEIINNKDEISKGKNFILSEFSNQKMIDSYVEKITNPNNKEDHDFKYIKSGSDNLYLAPWCSVENDIIYHDYLGWMPKTKDKIRVNDSGELLVDSTIVQYGINKRILIPTYIDE